MTIHIPSKYLWYAGAAIVLGAVYWYLKSSGTWDTWFNASGQLIPVPAPQPQQQQQQQSGGFSIPDDGTPKAGYVN